MRKAARKRLVDNSSVLIYTTIYRIYYIAHSRTPCASAEIQCSDSRGDGFVNLLRLQYFLTIINEGSFSAAARKMYISQQSLSEHIKKLEAELGAPLLKRERPLSLTPVGKRLASGAKEMLDAHDRMMQDIQALISCEQRKISIGISTYESPPFLPDLLTRFSAEYSEYEVSVVKRQDADVAQNMDGVDLYFSFLPLNDALDHVSLIEDDELCVIANKSLFAETYGEQWSSIERELLDTGDLLLLKDLPFILLYDRQGNIAQILVDIFDNAGFSPVVGFRSDNGDLNTSMCCRGRGACVGPSHLFCQRFKEHLSDGDDAMSLYKLSFAEVSAQLALSYRKGKTLSLIERQFIDMAKSYIMSMNQ